MTFAEGATKAALEGMIDERAGEVLREIRTQTKTPLLVFDCDGVTFINSIGVSTWIAHIKAFAGIDLRFVNATYPFASHCLIIPDLAGGGRIDSLYVRYYCEHCDTGDYQSSLATREEIAKQPRFRSLPCMRCRRPLAPDPDDGDFLALLQSEPAAAPKAG
jgi:hypothetical protein